MKSIGMKLSAAVIACLTGLFTIVSIIYSVTLYRTNYAEAENYVWAQCRESRSNFNDQLKRMEMAVDLVAYHTKYYINTSEEDISEKMPKFQSLAVDTARYTRNVYSVFFHANPDRYNNNYDFFYLFDGEDGTARKVRPRNPVTFETTTGIPAAWYYDSADSGQPRWVGPYNKHYRSDSGNEVVAYTVPLTDAEGRLDGVLGMEFSLKQIFEELNRIKLYHNGYMFLTDSEGTIMYHPTYEYGTKLEDVQSVQWNLVQLLLAEENPSRLIPYTLGGEERMMAATGLENGMVLIASAPKAEINAVFYRTITASVMVFLVIFIAANIIVLLITRHFLSPIRQLSQTSQKIMEGDMAVNIDYNREDEVGILIGNFKEMSLRLQSRLDQYSTMAYTDGMTGVNNKASFDVAVSLMEERIASGYTNFGVTVFDLNNLKAVNDRFGHMAGDRLIKTAASIISRSFVNSPVFRIGGDEFAVILEREDFFGRDDRFADMKLMLFQANENLPIAKQVSFAYGIALFREGSDKNFNDVFERADKLMYKHKAIMKSKGAANF